MWNCVYCQKWKDWNGSPAGFRQLIPKRITYKVNGTGQLPGIEAKADLLHV